MNLYIVNSRIDLGCIAAKSFLSVNIIVFSCNITRKSVQYKRTVCVIIFIYNYRYYYTHSGIKKKTNKAKLTEYT